MNNETRIGRHVIRDHVSDSGADVMALKGLNVSRVHLLDQDVRIGEHLMKEQLPTLCVCECPPTFSFMNKSHGMRQPNGRVMEMDGITWSTNLLNWLLDEGMIAVLVQALV
jgi:hypothetical protein